MTGSAAQRERHYPQIRHRRVRPRLCAPTDLRPISNSAEIQGVKPVWQIDHGCRRPDPVVDTGAGLDARRFAGSLDVVDMVDEARRTGSATARTWPSLDLGQRRLFLGMAKRAQARWPRSTRATGPAPPTARSWARPPLPRKGRRRHQPEPRHAAAPRPTT